MKKQLRKVLSVILAIGMLMSMFTILGLTEDATDPTWTKVDLAEITADDTIAITMTHTDGTTWVLPAETKTNKGISAIVVTVDGDTLTSGSGNYGWTFTSTDGGYYITNAEGKYLYVINDNNGVRVDTTPCVWSLDATGHYLAGADTNGTTRYLGVYKSTPDWRAYTNTTGNTKDQTVGFWKLNGEYVEPAEPELGTVAQALAGDAGVKYKVKGVVTMVDGRNVYVQDETGGICLYFDSAVNDLALGDTVIFTGALTVYKGLPELTGQTYEKSEGLTLTAKETTIGALTAADICTYVEIKGLEVTEVYDNNGAYSNPNITLKDGTDKTIQLYKAVVGKTDGAWDVKVGDKLSLKAAVGINNTTFQLRNTLATEIVIESSEPPVDPPAPTYNTVAEALAGAENAEFTVKGVVTLLDGKNVYVQDETGGICLYFAAAPSDLALGDTVIGTGARATYRGLPELSGATYEKSEGLTLTAKTATIGELTTADICTYVELKGVEVTEVYDNNGTYSTPNITVKDEAGATIQIYKAVVGKTDGAWDVKVGDILNIKAAVGVNNTTLQLRNTLASEIEIASEETETGLVTDLAQLTDGASVVIYNPSKAKAMSSEVLGNDWYLAAKDATIEDDKAVDPAADLIWTVKVNEDGSYTFEQGDKAVSAWLSGNYVELTSNAAHDGAAAGWTLSAANAETNTYYMASSTLSTSYGSAYIELFNKKVNGVEQLVFCGYSTSESKLTEADYGMQFYLVEAKTPDTPVEPGEGKNYGLSSSIATGDKVILYNAANGVAVGNTIASHKVSGVAFTPKDGVITTDNENVVWEVTVNSDNTVTLTQGDYTLGGLVSESNGKTYNNLVLTGAASTNWTLTGPDAADFNYFLSLNDMETNFGHLYLEYYNGYTLYGSTAPDKAAFGITFYKEGAEPEVPSGETGDLVTSLSQLTDGATVAIYSPGHKTAISTKPNGDWYLKANNATLENGKVVNFTSDFVWKVKVNEDGTYTFISNDDETKSITVWASGTYAEVTVDYEKYAESGDNTWKLDPAKTANCFYISSPKVSNEERGPAYLEAYVRNEFEVFSGYFTKTSSYNFTEENFALQFYLVNPEDAVEAVDDGEWDGVLEKGKAYVAYNASAESAIGLWDEANYSMKAIPTTVSGSKATAGNGAYVFKIDTYGRYYSFEIDGKYLATNPAEELFFVEANADGSAPEEAKWFLTQKEGGYIIYNKEVTYNGTPVCVEYYSSVFSGWTFSTKNDVGIYLFNFYEVADGTKVYGDVVQDPSVQFDCEDTRYFEQDYAGAFSLDDLAPEISEISITYSFGSTTGEVKDYESSADGKVYTFTLPASVLDEGKTDSFTLSVNVTNSYGITYSATKTVTNVDEPFFADLTPAPNAQTGEDKTPVISVKVGNVGDAPTFKMTLAVGDKAPVEVAAAYKDGVLSYQPAEALPDGRVTVKVEVVRADSVTAEKAWSFTVGKAGYQLYFGQLHSHTTYSDGSGSLETALDYIASLPESANVDFVAFTDHSNYFDTISAANPADALNDKSLMTDASRALWDTYKGTVANFNAKQNDMIALAGFEMTWSGGPGHINTYNSDGLVSRNNAALNNKSGDAGMKLYYETVNKGESLNQFNHPGTTFGNFNDFSYWDEETDAHMFLVEVGNGEGQIGAGGYYPSYEQYDLALSKGWHIAPTNNQDNHKGRWGNANDARDVILAESFTEEGIYDAIRNLRVYATEDKNLEIVYTVNDMPMGTVFGEEKPETLNVAVTLYDPDATDAIQKVEVIADGGKVVHTWSDAVEIAEGALSVALQPDETYYYIRVTQKDGDLAVTAPVWVGNGVSAGISEFKSEKDVAVVNETVNLTATLFNNEKTDATVTSVVYTANGKEIGKDTETRTVPANGTLDVIFAYTPTEIRRQTVTATVTLTINGKARTYTKDLILSVREHEGALDVTDVSKVRAVTEEGYEYAIEGVVTSNASGYDKDTAFFDCIYVQDATGGICCFPVSGEFKIGDKVHVEGYTDFYQGEPELQVTSIEVIGEGKVEPTEVTAKEINDLSHLGDLVTLKGTVDSFEVVNGLIQTIMVKDEAGNLARVFIDGYITTGKEVENVKVGADITATGLSSYDDTWPDTEYFARIRIRNRADIVCTEPEEPAVEYEAPVWTWNEDGSAASAVFTPKDGSAPVKVEAKITSETTAPTTDSEGKTVYTATVTGPDGKTYTSVKEVVIPKLPYLTALNIGDINNDGKVTAADARLALRAAVGLEDLSKIDDKAVLRGNVDFKDGVTASDARLILRAAVGLEDREEWMKNAPPVA